MIAVSRTTVRLGQPPLNDDSTCNLPRALWMLIHDEFLMRGSSIICYGMLSQKFIVEWREPNRTVLTSFTSDAPEELARLVDAAFYYSAATDRLDWALYDDRELYFARRDAFVKYRELLRPGYVDRFAVMLALGLVDAADHAAITSLTDANDVPDILQYRTVDAPTASLKDIIAEFKLETASDA